MKPRKRFFDRPYLLLPLAPLFWSGNFIVGRAVRMALPPVGLAFWRWSLGFVLILGLAWPHLKRDWPTLRQHWRIMLALSVFGIAAFNTLVYTGLQFTTAINGVLMQSFLPVVIVSLTYLWFRETVTLFQVLGILLSLGGVVTIITRGNPHTLLELSFNHGDLVIMLAVFCYATYSVLLQKRPPVHPFSVLAVTFGAGAGLLLPVYLWEHFSVQAMPVTRVTLLAVGYVAVFPSIVSYLCFNRGVELIGANRAGLFSHLMPVFGSILAIIFLGETFHGFHAAGMALIFSGIVFATRLTAQRG